VKPGGVAAIHRAQLKKAKEELARIEEALDHALIVSNLADESTATRVEALCDEVIRLRQKVNDLEWEAAG
jgi:hypothetical protein